MDPWANYGQGWNAPQGGAYGGAYGGINYNAPLPGSNIQQGRQQVYQPATGVGQAVQNNNLGGLIDLQVQGTQQAQDNTLAARQQAMTRLGDFAQGNNLQFNQLSGQLGLNGNPFDALFNQTRNQITSLMGQSRPVEQTGFERQLQDSISRALNTAVLSPQQIEMLETIGKERIASTTGGIQNAAMNSLAERGLQGSGISLQGLADIKQGALGQLQQNLNDATIQGATLNRQGLQQAQGAGQQFAGLQQQRLQHNQDLEQQQRAQLAQQLAALTGQQAQAGLGNSQLAIQSLLSHQGQQGNIAALLAQIGNTEFKAPDYSGFGSLALQQQGQQVGQQQQNDYLNLMRQQMQLQGLQQYGNTSDPNVRRQIEQNLGLQLQNSFSNPYAWMTQGRGQYFQ